MSNENIIDETWPVGHRFAVSLTVKEKGAAGYFMNHMKPKGDNEELYGCDVEAIHFKDSVGSYESAYEILADRQHELGNLITQLGMRGSAAVDKLILSERIRFIMNNWNLSYEDIADRLAIRNSEIGTIDYKSYSQNYENVVQYDLGQYLVEVGNALIAANPVETL